MHTLCWFSCMRAGASWPACLGMCALPTCGSCRLLRRLHLDQAVEAAELVVRVAALGQVRIAVRLDSKGGIKPSVDCTRQMHASRLMSAAHTLPLPPSCIMTNSQPAMLPCRQC
jgi:hypothetical protein